MHAPLDGRLVDGAGQPLGMLLRYSSGTVVMYADHVAAVKTAVDAMYTSRRPYLANGMNAARPPGVANLRNGPVRRARHVVDEEHLHGAAVQLHPARAGAHADRALHRRHPGQPVRRAPGRPGHCAWRGATTASSSPRCGCTWCPCRRLSLLAVSSCWASRRTAYDPPEESKGLERTNEKMMDLCLSWQPSESQGSARRTAKSRCLLCRLEGIASSRCRQRLRSSASTSSRVEGREGR